MREIKFRAWHNINKFMLENGEISVLLKNLNNKVVVPTWNFMQYTGLKDRNDVEIYEGDIVIPESSHVENQGNYIVEWDFVSFHMKHNEKMYFMAKCVWSGCEVIGNVCDNKGLL